MNELKQKILDAIVAYEKKQVDCAGEFEKHPTDMVLYTTMCEYDGVLEGLGIVLGMINEQQMQKKGGKDGNR